MAFKILIVQEEAEKYHQLIREKFPEQVENGEIQTVLAKDEKDYSWEDIKDINAFVTFPLIPETPDLKELKWAMTLSSGYDHWEKSGLLPEGIPLIHVPGGSAIPIAEFTMGVMLNYEKHYDEIRENQKEHKYIRIQGGELYGKTLGIIGLGGIGRELARKAKAFDMHVIGTEIEIRDIPNVDQVYLAEDFEKVLEQSDYVVLSVPDTPKTRGMMGEEQFKKMKKTAYFINCARGSLVQKEAMTKACKEGWIAGAHNDTHWIKYPLPSYLPEDDELWDVPNISISPHISSWTDMYAKRFGAVMLENIERYLQGKELVSVSPLKYKKS